MPMYKIKAVERVTYIYEVEADTIEEAIQDVEDGVCIDCHEVDSSSPSAVAYTIEGQMGWNTITNEE